MNTQSVKTTLGDLWLRVISPMSWSVWLRRLFLIILPVSAPIYLVIIIGLLVLLLIAAVTGPIAEFWNAPQQRLRGGYYGYEYSQRRRRRRSEIDSDSDSDGQNELPLDE